MNKRSALFLGLGFALIAAEALAAPPPRGGTGPSAGGNDPLSGTTSGAPGSATVIYQPPAGATFTPDTTADPGIINSGPARPNDVTAGAPTGVDGAAQGYDVYDEDILAAEGVAGNTQPEFHIVREGDTLWDICDYYFRDPYLWPKVWSYNEQITNAHWIFPGDRVRLSDPYDRGLQEEADVALSWPEKKKQQVRDEYLLNRFAFVDSATLEQDMEVIGGAEAKVMMSTNDTAYIGYEARNPPIGGERLTVYRPQAPVYDLKLKGKRGQRQKKGKQIGWLVEVVGEVYINKVAKKSADATVVDSIRPVERGMKVGDLKTRFIRVAERDSDITDNGLVVETIRDMELNGEEHFVVTNLGANHAIKRGNVLEVVRKGDEYTSDHRLHSPYEEGHPRRIVGRVLVLQVEEETSLGVVLWSKREITRGDHVEIRAAGMSESDEPTMRSIEAEADGRVDRGDGSLKASGSLTVGG